MGELLTPTHLLVITVVALVLFGGKGCGGLEGELVRDCVDSGTRSRESPANHTNSPHQCLPLLLRSPKDRQN
jgi:hypothetical protein